MLVPICTGTFCATAAAKFTTLTQKNLRQSCQRALEYKQKKFFTPAHAKAVPNDKLYFKIYFIKEKKL